MDRRDLERLSGMAGLLDGADHVDVHTMDGRGTVLGLAAGLLSYRPAWMAWLWRVRVALLRTLGQGERAVPDRAVLTAETLPRAPGDRAGIFTVVRTDGETYWIGEGKESHLDAAVAVCGESLSEGPDGRSRFRVVTVVRYRNRAGAVYFNLIRPFHHLVVHAAMRSFLGRERG
ncbi:hypothetical protein DND132_2255 [Pseudodesulfovibrio mercurii]|uniref:DUF2867 domain-containing protein n=1 Tax=Pseudodesulfovibrio mercurii TaxID=641491 RepID=F0JIM5_9BACT|nr:DUF2867 domain-containing protein [Pseudodesulfovibrio mercurii]EGB15459.1 hypothetical protein DND132_2255 [Pseudodesulfovibrio mercurii]